MANKEHVLHQIQLDLKTVEALENRGTNLHAVHKIEHHHLSKSEESLSELLRLGKILRFQPSGITRDVDENGRPYFYADLVSDQYIETSLLNCESLLMLGLAEAFGCEYDGWGTEVEE
jgi:regulator of ribonuclease activity B